MKIFLTKAILAFHLLGAAASIAAASDTEPGFIDRVQQRLSSTWKDGDTEVYIPLYTYHLRSAYSKEAIEGFNEVPRGLGIGRGLFDEKGDWHGLFAMAFQDSHFKPEYTVGYGYKTYWPISGDFKVGLGYTAFLTSRTDINHYVPIPGILPIASLEYKKVAFDAFYLPGHQGDGNIVFFWSKVHF